MFRSRFIFGVTIAALALVATQPSFAGLLVHYEFETVVGPLPTVSATPTQTTPDSSGNFVSSTTAPFVNTVFGYGTPVTPETNYPILTAGIVGNAGAAIKGVNANSAMNFYGLLNANVDRVQIDATATNTSAVASLNATYTNFSFAAWVNPSSLTSDRFLAGKMGSAGQRGWQIYSGTGTTNLTVDYFQTASAGDRSFTLTDVLPLNTWTHVAFTYDGTAGTEAIYINGVAQSISNTGTLPTTPSNLNATNTASFRIGHRGGQQGSVGGWKGGIDDARVYDTTLDAAAVSALFLPYVPEVMAASVTPATNTALVAGNTITITDAAPSGGFTDRDPAKVTGYTLLGGNGFSTANISNLQAAFGGGSLVGTIAHSPTGLLNGPNKAVLSFNINDGPTGVGTGSGSFTYTLAATVSGNTGAQATKVIGGDTYGGLSGTSDKTLASVASLLGGTNSAASTTAANVSMVWRDRTAEESTTPTTPPLPSASSKLTSDVVTLAGITAPNLPATTTDAFVLQMSYDASQIGNEADRRAAGELYLSWFDGTSNWVNAIAGNTNVGSSPTTNFNGTYSAFLNSNPFDPSTMLGSWGVDTAGNVVWAIVDHTGDFSSLVLNNAVALLTGDVNGDNIVNQLDLNVVFGNWLSTGASLSQGDANNDGVINQLDINTITGNWLATGPAGGLSSSVVPEPSSLLLLSLGLCGVIGRARGKKAAVSSFAPGKQRSLSRSIVHCVPA